LTGCVSSAAEVSYPMTGKMAYCRRGSCISWIRPWITDGRGFLPSCRLRDDPWTSVAGN